MSRQKDDSGGRWAWLRPRMQRPEAAWMHTLAGAVSGAVARALVTPLDVIKIRMQLQVESAATGKYRNTLHCAATMVREEGLRALWRGHMASQTLAITYCAVQFPVYEQARDLLFPMPYNTAFSDFLAGSVAGMAATVSTYPFDILRTRLAAQSYPVVYHSMSEGAKAILAKEGFRGFFRGLSPSLVTIVPNAGLSFMLYKSFLRYLTPLTPWFGPGRPMSPRTKKFQAQRVIAGALSGGVTKALLHPLDVIKKRLQVSEFGDARKQFGRTQVYRGMMDCIRILWQQEGLAGFYKGLGPAMLKAVPNTMITFVVYDWAMAFVVGGDNNNDDDGGDAAS